MAPAPDGGGLFGAASPPRADLPGDDPDDPDFEAPAARKKKHVYRREVQAKYRAKLKVQRAELEAAVDDARLQTVALEEANRHLAGTAAALELTITGPAAHYTRVLAAARPPAPPPPVPAPCTAPRSIAERLDWVFSGNIIIREDDVMDYMSQPEDALLALEREFLTRLAAMYEAWAAGAGSRAELERRMQGALVVRIHVAQVLPKCPQKHLALTRALPPPPGSPAGDSAHRALAALVPELSFTPRQRMAMAQGLREYQTTVEALQAEAAAALEALRGGALPADDEEPMARTARRALAAARAADTLRALPQRMLGAYSRLAGTALAPLSCVQAVRLLLGCRPWLPDHVQVAKLATSGAEWVPPPTAVV